MTTSNLTYSLPLRIILKPSSTSNQYPNLLPTTTPSELSPIEKLLCERLELNPYSSELSSAILGFIDAQNRRKRNLWKIWNIGHQNRKYHDWSLEQTQNWIIKHQRLYEQGYEYEAMERGPNIIISDSFPIPLFPASKEYVSRN